MLEIDKYSRVPIYEQIIAGFERIILTDEISLHDAMPSVRRLSQELSVNPNTLQKAYSEMENRGLCFSVPGSGRFVSPRAKEILMSEKRKELDEVKRLCEGLRSCGISEEECIAVVKKAFEGGIS